MECFGPYAGRGGWRSPSRPIPARQGRDRAFAAGGTKAEQQAEGRAAAKRDRVEHTIKKKDGTIGEKNSYGNDPRRSKG